MADLFDDFKVEAPELKFDETVEPAEGASVADKFAEAEASVASMFNKEDVVEVAEDAIEIVEEEAEGNAGGEASETA